MQWKSKIYKQKSRKGEEAHWLELPHCTLILTKEKDSSVYFLSVNDGEGGSRNYGWMPTLESAKEKILRYT